MIFDNGSIIFGVCCTRYMVLVLGTKYLGTHAHIVQTVHISHTVYNDSTYCMLYIVNTVHTERTVHTVHTDRIVHTIWTYCTYRT